MEKNVPWIKGLLWVILWVGNQIGLEKLSFWTYSQAHPTHRTYSSVHWVAVSHIMTILRSPLITNGLSIGKTSAISVRNTIRSRKSFRSLLKRLFQLQILKCLISHSRQGGGSTAQGNDADFFEVTLTDFLKHI